MRIFPTVLLAGFCLLAHPVLAGEVTIANGQVGWKSTQCAVPVVPPVLSGVGKEDAANDVNARVVQYNAYTKATQAYMDCLSSEAQTDANAAAAAVVASAQAQISGVQKQADALGADLRK